MGKRIGVTAKRAVLAALLGLLLDPLLLAGTITGYVRNTGSVGLASAVVFVDDIAANSPVPAEAAVVEQRELRFVPHVLVVLVGTRVEFPNNDPLSHNVFSISEAKRFNLGLYTRGKNRWLKFDRPGVVELLCNVHLEMSGYIVVVKNPYFAVSGANGSYRIAGVPAGRHRLRYWHERFPMQERTVEVSETGTVTLDLAPPK